MSSNKSLASSLSLSSTLLSILLLISFVLVSSAPTDYKYLGCYLDDADVQKRALPLGQLLDAKMTVEKCLMTCEEHGLQYGGLEYKHECYCSDKPPRYEKLSEDRCNQECGGSSVEKCGGALALSVYHHKSLQPTPDAKRPLLCLVMILKNEAHTILNTLESVKDAIDNWQILDTGSDDGTQKIITDFFEKAKIPGKLYQEPFVDYGATRNRILVLAKENVNPIFTLMLSADERLDNPTDLRNHVKRMQYAFGTHHGAYPVQMDTGIKFDSIRLARVDAGWRYKARVHEYLAPAEGPYVSLVRPVPEVHVLFNATDGPRRFQSQFFIRKILEEDLAKNPNDTRSIYYLARTNSGVNNHSQAYYYYDLLSKRSQWDEEIYHGMLMKAIETKYLPEFSWRDRQSLFLDAYAYKPDNMDALHALAQDHFDSGRFRLAYLFAMQGINCKLPPNLPAIENVLLRPTKYLYDYEMHRLLGFAAREVGDWEQCVKSFQHVLKVNPSDTIVADRIKFCQNKVTESGKKVAPILDIPNKEEKTADVEKLTIPSPPFNPRDKSGIVRNSDSPIAALLQQEARQSQGLHLEEDGSLHASSVQLYHSSIFGHITSAQLWGMNLSLIVLMVYLWRKVVMQNGTYKENTE